jgi:ATP-dependent DNA helicase RecQ
MNSNEALTLLRDTFGHSAFKTCQETVIHSVMNGENALVIMPTGSGKSLCYQLPAVLRPGTGIIISPLISLMEDQVSGLNKLGFRATVLNSSLHPELTAQLELDIHNGKYDFVYLSPERLTQSRTLRILKNISISLFAIDEAHCISQWGHNFRIEYTELKLLKREFPQIPIIALTATADHKSRDDIINGLGLSPCKTFITSFNRENIRYQFRIKDNSKQQLLHFLKEQNSSPSGIVYCLSRKKVDELTAYLRLNGYDCIPYHAGLDSTTRKENQRKFLEHTNSIMVATIAFGMGINKPNVRFVVHMDLPKSIEAYSQETGRAGRDGEPATALLFYSVRDVMIHRQIIRQSQRFSTEYAKVKSMFTLCEHNGCKRQYLLNYFGEDFPATNCGNCDYCLAPTNMANYSLQAQKLLSVIFRTNQQYGLSYLIDILQGKVTAKNQDSLHTQLGIFGQGKELSIKEWNSLYRQLFAEGYIDFTDTNDYAMTLQESCRPLLKGTLQFNTFLSPK